MRARRTVPEDLHRIRTVIKPDLPIDFLIERPDYLERFVWTLEAGPEIAALLGLVLLRPGVASVWHVLAREALRQPVAFSRWQKRLLLGEISRYALHRVETQVRSDRRGAIRWLTKMGFECETPQGMKGYVRPGDLYLQFARIT